MNTVLIRFLQSLGLIFVLLALLVFWLIGTSSGLGWMVDRLQPTLKIESIQGALGSFQFNGLEVSVDGTRIQIDNGSLEWDLGNLLFKKVEIDALILNGVDIITAKTAQASSSYTGWQGLDMPVDVVVTNAQINKLTFSDGNESRTELDKIGFAATVINNLLQIKHFDVVAGDDRAQISGELDLSAGNDGAVDLKNEFAWRLAEIDIEGQGSLSGHWQSLRLTQSLTSPVYGQLSETKSEEKSATINAIISDVLETTISWQADIETAGMGKQTVADTELAIRAGKFDLNGSFDLERGIGGLDLSMLGAISGGNADISYWSLDTDVRMMNGDIAVNKLKLTEQADKNPATLTAHGRIERATRFLTEGSELGQIDLQGALTDFRWPLAVNAKPSKSSNKESSPIDIASVSGDFAITGTSERYAVKSKVKGRANGKPMNADIDLALGKSVIINNLIVSSGQSKLQVKGTADQQLNLNWDLQSPDLGDLLLGAKGALSSAGQLTGDRAKPSFTLKANSASLQWSDYSGRDIAISVQGALSSLSERIDLSVEAGSLDIGSSRVVQNLKVSIAGTGREHSISVNSILEQDTQLVLQANGRLMDVDKQLKWDGGIEKLSLSGPKLGNWGLEGSSNVRHASGSVFLSPSCMSNQGQSVCAQISSSNSSGLIDAKIDLKQLNLAAFNRFLSDYDIDLKGIANGELIYLRKSSNAIANISGFVESNSAVLSWFGSGDLDSSDETITFDSVRLEVNQQTQLEGSLSAVLSSGDRLDAQLGVATGFGSTNFSSSPLKGSGKLQIADLSILPTALMNAINMNGSFDSEFNIGGSIDSPEIAATGALADAHMEIPELGLVLKDINIRLSSDGSPKLKLLGQLASGAGLLKIDGAMDFKNIREPVMTISLKGENIQLSDTPELTILGDVSLLANFENNLFDLDGSVKLNEAELDFKVPEIAVLASDDVVLLGVETESSKIEQRINLNIDLGEKTHIRAKGLDAKLAGKLRVFREQAGIMRGEGQINISEGRYRAYGQDLKIDKGRLVFSGGSIEDPNLDLTAQKTVGDVAVGVSVTGRANAPRLNLYSNPSMPDQDILAVLLFNKRVDELGATDGLTLLRIANSLRGDGEPGGVAQMTDKLQQSLGLTNLEFQLSSDAPSIVAGKQFSSRFYVGYGYGLLDAAQSLILRYKLSDAWSVKADVGANSGADLLYRVER